MDYKKEMNRMKAHRMKYAPALTGVLSTFQDIKKTGSPVEITSNPDLFIILELIDIGMLDPDAFTIDMNRTTVESVFQNNIPPLTQSGEKLIEQDISDKKKLLRKTSIIILLSISIITVIIWIII